MKDYLVLTTDIITNLETISTYEGIQADRLPEIQTLETQSLLPALLHQFSDTQDWTPDSVLIAVRQAGKDAKVKGKHLWMPLRIMMTNEDQGPEIYLVIYLMGKNKVLGILQDLQTRI
jgi:glutamyl/glutaminyl-tRNA synthetase